MVAVAGRNVEKALAGDIGRFALVLVYGPDQGLVTQRSERIARAIVGRDADELSILRLDGDDLAADPLRLADEANTIAMFGGKRAIRVRSGSRSLMPALEPVLSAPPLDAGIIIEAGDLKPSSPLRAAFEQSAVAAAIPCYPDEASDLARLIDDSVAAAGLRIVPAARDALVGTLGADRLRSVSEIDKLLMYARGLREIGLAEVEAVIADAAPVDTDAAIDAAFGGKVAAIESLGGRVFADGLEPGTFLGFALRHALTLRQLRADIDGGAPRGEVVRRARVHFRRQPMVEMQLAEWSVDRLDRAIGILSDAIPVIRQTPRLGRAIAVRALWSVALSARRT